MTRFDHGSFSRAIKPDGKGNCDLQGIETNFILMVYGKKDFGKYFSEHIIPDTIIYYNERQGRKLEALAELQLFRCHLVARDLIGPIICRPTCLVNKEVAGQDTYGLETEARASKTAATEVDLENIVKDLAPSKEGQSR